MRFPKKDVKDTIVYNSKITIENIPAKAYERGGPQKSDSRIRCKIRQTIRRPQSNEQSETEAVHS